ncbi:hypothetical protein ACFY0N_00820 [Streptomyces vinaceus]|uniref:hypothetical protein n=1 Tax=Streptomyces vinaceus TaxID=1960 RepID=UPI0036A2B78F
MAPRRTVRIPAARFVAYRDLQARLSAANELAYELNSASAPEEFQKVMDALNEAYWIAADLAHQRSRTGCTYHPHGAVDPEPPEGWGHCLICNGWRRSGKTIRNPDRPVMLTGATSATNRPAARVVVARQSTPLEAAQWREPEFRPGLDSPILAARRERSDSTHTAALIKARQEKAARKKAEAEARNARSGG